MNTVERIRSAVPVAATPAIAALRARWAMRDPRTRDDAERHMEFLLGRARPDVDIAAAAYASVRFQLWRTELQRHLVHMSSRAVLDHAHLARLRAEGRGAIVHFLHHGLYEASLASLGRSGLIDGAVAEPDLARDDLTGSRRALAQVLRAHGRVWPVDIGAAGISDLVRSGSIVALVSDRPGRTASTFCGRTVYSASGAARVSQGTGVPIVLLRAVRSPDGRVVGRVGPTVRPQDFASPASLLQHLMALHESAVLAWPEAYAYPRDCFGTSPAPVPGAQ